jgi:hypothetical protein
MVIEISNENEIPDELVDTLSYILTEMDEAQTQEEKEEMRAKNSGIKYTKNVIIGINIGDTEAFFTFVASSDDGLTYILNMVLFDFPFVDNFYTYQLTPSNVQVVVNIFRETLLRENIDVNLYDYSSFF